MQKLLLVLLSGVAVGVLIAPAKGTATIRKLVNAFNALREDTDGEFVI